MPLKIFYVTLAFGLLLMVGCDSKPPPVMRLDIDVPTTIANCIAQDCHIEGQTFPYSMDKKVMICTKTKRYFRVEYYVKLQEIVWPPGSNTSE